jgi:hypothetical protein
VFQRIFYGLSMSSTVYARKVRVWVTPYERGQDQLSVMKNDYERVISANFSLATGVLELVQKGGRELTKFDWDEILNQPTYRLYINVRCFTGDLLRSFVFTVLILQAMCPDVM